MVGNGADAKCTLTCLCSVHVKTGCLHLNCHDAHITPLVGGVLAHGSVEVVGGHDVADLHINAVLLCGFNSLAEKGEIGDGSEGAVELELVCEVGVGACTLCGNDVHQLKVITQSACGADADDVVNIVEVVQLVAVNADCGDAHAGSHYGHGNALPGAGVTLNATDIVYENGIFKEGFCDELCTKGIAGHKHGLCDFFLLCSYMGGGNRHNFSSDKFICFYWNYIKQIAKVKLQECRLCDKINQIKINGRGVLSLSDIIVIGIAGGTGSGKTTITRKIIQNFGGDVSVIYHDNYYKAHHSMSYEDRTKLNYDHPDAFDTELMIADLLKLRAGQTVQCPTYDYTIHDRAEKTVTVKPAKVIVVEGILIFQSQELCDLMDIKIYVDTDADVRILRRIVRDVRDRGRSLESVVNQYLQTVKPMHEQFVEPSKRKADIIIPEGGHNQVALEMVLERVRAHLAR